MFYFDEETDSRRETLFIEVILPLALNLSYTYRIPYHLNNQIQIGKRVVVQFGKSKIYTAIISAIAKKPPQNFEVKYIIDVLDEQPIIHEHQITFWEWIKDYYLCTIGEVMTAALPSALKLASETRIVLNKEHQVDKNTLNDKEFLVVEALELKPELFVSDIIKILGQKSVFPLLRILFSKQIINIYEEISQKYKPRFKTIISLNDFYEDKQNLKQLFEELNRAPKQQDILLSLIKLSKQKTSVTKEQLLEDSAAGSTSLKALLDKEILVTSELNVSRLPDYTQDEEDNFELTEKQQQAFTEIKKKFGENQIALLHGITASGKTQVYVKLIEQYLEQDKQVLYLLPEIALTTQIIERLKVYFGNKIAVYHSKFNDNERAEVWQKVLSGECKIVLGARSAVFLPFQTLSLVIVDEEHEASYKQYDPAPRYNARDAAIMLANLLKANVLLGSATPSVESYFNAKTGKYALIKLQERYSGVKLPQIEVVSIIEELKKKTLKSNFSSTLLAEIKQTLDAGEQVILFQNRRGYVPLLVCEQCAYTPKCINCDVSLTYHKSSDKLHCHYCGYQENTPNRCPACGSVNIKHKGFGTEKIEDDLQTLMPEIKIARMDLDTTRTKYSHQQILNDFEDKKTDVLVGTQMVAKGLDFGKVNVIGVINADSMLKYPDFRAYERSFQLLSQVAGRAGRRDKQGKVIIQTFDVKHRVIKQVVEHDYEGLFEAELLEREQYNYPPFYRLIQLDVKHKDATKAYQSAYKLAVVLQQLFGDMVLGPQTPLISRIRNYYINSILIKANKQNTSIIKLKSTLKIAINDFQSQKEFKNVVIKIDVDPY